jgi:hypothetical protein
MCWLWKKLRVFLICGPGRQAIRIGGAAFLKRAAFLSICVAAVACKCDTAVSIRGDTIPTFSLSGNGALSFLTVNGPKRESKTEHLDGEFLYWEIDSAGGKLDARYFNDLGTVTYGKVPPAYRQVFPVEGDPVPLLEGETYTLRVYTLGLYSKDVSKRFTIRDGNPVDVAGN